MKNEEIIHKYLNGTLTKNESENFKRQLQEDSELLEQLTEQIITEHGRMQLKETLRQIGVKHRDGKKNYRLILIKTAAGLALLFSGGYFLTHFIFNQPSTNNHSQTFLEPSKQTEQKNHKQHVLSKKSEPDHSSKNVNITSHEVKNDDEMFKNAIAENAIFENYYKPYPLPVTRGIEKELKSAYQYYNIEKYDSALYYFENALKTSKSEEQINTILFFAGNCLIENYILTQDTTLTEKAIKYMEALSADSSSEYFEQAKWYVALLSIEKGKTNKGVDVLDEIIRNKLYNFEQAQNVKSNLQNK